MLNKPQTQRVLIYGGAFDPPHFGHALCLETAMRLAPCDEIWLMPSTNQRADKVVVAAAEQRIKMLELMVDECFPKSTVPIVVSDFEIKRPELTTTNCVYQELRRLYPKTAFSFLFSSVLLPLIQREWVEGKEFYESAKLVIVEQAHCPTVSRLPSNVTVLRDLVVSTNLSSTLIRALLQQGHDGRPYLTRAVADYIKSERLYSV